MVWSNDSSSEITTGSLMGHIQPAGLNLAQSQGLRYSKAFTVWMAVGSDIQAGDRLNDGSRFYSVKAVTERSYGANRHIQAVVERDETFISA